MTTRPIPIIQRRFDWRRLRAGCFTLRRTVRRAPSAVELAHADIAARAAIGADTCRDIGRSPADATGTASYQPALPFFMQAGFDR